MDAISEAKSAEGDVNNYQMLSGNLDTPIADLEDELKKGLPGTPGKSKAKVKVRKEAQLKKLKKDKLELDNLALEATVAQTNFERLSDEAKLARDNFVVEAQARDAELPQAEAALDLAKITPRLVNPRFAPKSSKASNKVNYSHQPYRSRKRAPPPLT